MAKKLMSDLERFDGKYLEDALTGCWNWKGSLDKDGYAAQMKIGSRTDGTRCAVRPARWIYGQIVGKIPDHLVVDHLCRNRRCVNPFHLEPVTPRVNTQRGVRATTKVCKYGHDLEGENLVVVSTGKRRCRICLNAYARAYNKANGHLHSKRYRQRWKGKAKSVGVTN